MTIFWPLIAWAIFLSVVGAGCACEPEPPAARSDDDTLIFVGDGVWMVRE